jgi:hypothetical protein
MTLILNGTNGLSDVDGDASTPAVRGTDANSGIFFGTTERMRIDTSGNVGIGTSSPASDARLTLDNGGSGSVALMFRRSGSGEVDCAIQNDAALVFRAGTDSSTVAGITERARITSGGDLLVGTTTGVGSGRQELIVGGNAGGTYIGLGRSGTNAANIQLDSGDNLSIQNTASQPINVVATTNGVTLANGGTSWGAFSDERKKDIIEPITNAAEKVSSLRAVIGKYKTEEDGIRRSMLIAQDVQAVLPEAVVENNDGDLILHYTDTIPLLVAAIKELKAELDTVKAELATLKG